MIRPALLLLVAGTLLLPRAAYAQDEADPWEGLRGEAAAPPRPAPARPAPPKPAAPKPAAPKPVAQNAAAGMTPSVSATSGTPAPAAASTDKPVPAPKPAAPKPAPTAVAPASAPPAPPAQPRTAAPQSPAAPSGSLPTTPAAQAMNGPAAAPKPAAPPPAPKPVASPVARPVGVAPAADPAAAPLPVAAPKPVAPAKPAQAPLPAAAPLSPAAPNPAAPAPAAAAYAAHGAAPMPLPPRRPRPPEPVLPMAPTVPAAAPVPAPANPVATAVAAADPGAMPAPPAAEAIGADAPAPAIAVPATAVLAPAVPATASPAGPAAPVASNPVAAAIALAVPSAHAAEPAHNGPPAAMPAQGQPADPSSAHADAAAPHGAPAAAPTGRTDIYPVTLVRRLQRLQDLIAAGSTAGIAQQRAMINEMDAAFAEADPSVWQDPANARALVMYFLGGGNPAVLRTIINREPKPNIDEKLLTGSLLYLEGREEPALRQLGEIDARKLPNGIGGQIALAQAALTVRADPAKASRLLEVARLLMPGTLVDEASLRRAVLVAAQAGDLDQFERLSGQYFGRFRHSAYAGNFRQRFAAALSRMNVLATPDGLARLDALLAPLDEEARREVFLLVSRAAIVEGKTALATASAERAMALAPVASRDAERARVYLGAAQAATPDRYKAAEEALKAIDRARLDPSDQALLEAARRTAELIRRADEAPATPPPATSPSAAPAVLASAQTRRAPAGEGEKPSAALTKAQAKLGEIDALLKDAPR